MIQVLAGAASVRKRIEDAFSYSVADLDEQSTPDNMSKWDKLTGTSFGTSGGKVSTSTTANSIYILKNGYKSVRVTAALDALSGGDAIYFRVKDANNWIRVREYSTYSSNYSQCTYTSMGGYTVGDASDDGSCYGTFSSANPSFEYQTVCGQQIIGYANFVWNYRPECYSTTVWKLISYYNYGYNEVNLTKRDWQYSVAIEKMENGTLTTLGTPQTYSRPQITASTWTNAIPTTGDQPNAAHTLTVEVTPTLISYTGYNVSGSVSNTDLADFAGVGIGRGSSSIYTASGLNSIAIDIL